MIVVWPQYLNKNLSLSKGRKVPLNVAVKDPSVKDITKALKKLNIKYNVQKEKSYPGRWYEHSGRVLVESEMKKNELLKEICKNIKK